MKILVIRSGIFSFTVNYCTDLTCLQVSASKVLNYMLDELRLANSKRCQNGYIMQAGNEKREEVYITDNVYIESAYFPEGKIVVPKAISDSGNSVGDNFYFT